MGLSVMQELRDKLAHRAREEGFAGFGICSPDAAARSRARMRPWLEAGAHGEMGWLEHRAHWRESPRTLWPEARSVIMLADRYSPPAPPPSTEGQGVVAAYACGPDYHDLVKKRLKRLGRWLLECADGEIKVFVDTAPVMEKPLAEAAGIGWQGKHTNLVSTRLGSWFVLGSIFTTLDLPRDPPHPDRCGSCRKCLDICPTAAFPAPYQLDARRCISYLTIELKTPIPRPMRPLIGNRVFGCDDCLAVCPWNRFAAAAAEGPRTAPDAEDLRSLARLSEEAFRARFRGTPVRRTGRTRMLRNVMVALGNSGDREALLEVEASLLDDSPLVRGAAVWALSRLATPARFEAMRQKMFDREADADVREEWQVGRTETVS